mgnify:CR=1 FL=1
MLKINLEFDLSKIHNNIVMEALPQDELEKFDQELKDIENLFPQPLQNNTSKDKFPAQPETKPSSQKAKLESELSQLKTKLKQLENQKLQKQAQSLKSKSSFQLEAKQLSAYLQSLQNEYSSQSSLYSKIKALRESISPLEVRVSSIRKSKLELTALQTQIQNEVSRLENTLNMCAEEIQSRYAQRAEKVALREELEEIYERLKLDYSGNLEDLRTQEKQVNLTHKRLLVAERVQNLELSLFEINSRLEEFKSKVDNSQNDSEKSDSELQEIEDYLSYKSEELSLPQLFDLVLEVNAESNHDLDEQILREQLNEVNRQENLARKEWNKEQTEIGEKMKACQDNWEEVEQLEVYFEEQQRKYRNIFIAIGQWKSEVESVLSEASDFNKVSDDSILTEFKNLLLNQITQEEYEFNFQSQLSKYLELLNKKEEEARKCLQSGSAFFKKCIENLERDKSLILNEKEQLALKLQSYSETQSTPSTQSIEKICSAQEQYLKQERLIVSDTYKLKYILNPMLLQSTQVVSKTKSELSPNEDSIKQFQSEEDSLNFQIENLMKNQKPEIKNSKHFVEVKKSNLQKLTNQIEKTKSNLKKTQEKIKTIETKSEETLKSIEQQAESCKAQIQSLENSLANLGLAKRTSIKINKENSRSKSPMLYENKDLTPPKSHFRNLSENKLQENPVQPIKHQHRMFIKRHSSQGNKLRSIRNSVKSSQEDSQIERVLHERVIPLIKGSTLYIKLSEHSTVFDALSADKSPPESCGYSVRCLSLHKSLTKLEVKQRFKQTPESSISLANVVAPVIPQSTMNILRVQNKRFQAESQHNEKFAEIKENDPQSRVYKQKCLECSFYAFSINLTQGGRVDLIATSYTTFKNWINGLNSLVKHKKYVPKVQSKLES